MCFLIFLYILQFIHYERLISCRVVVQGPGPGPRYGHVMALVGQRYLMAIGGNDGNSLRIQASSFFLGGGGGVGINQIHTLCIGYIKKPEMHMLSVNWT